MVNTGRRHYRVAKKEVAEKPSGGDVLIPRKQKPATIAIIAAVTVLIFIKGILIGYLVGSSSKGNTL